jgi:predicted  nucleic acid-binding Zn-ribbon protein
LQLYDVNFIYQEEHNMETKVKKTKEEKIQANKELLEILRKKKENLEIQILNLETRIRNLERTPDNK